MAQLPFITPALATAAATIRHTGVLIIRQPAKRWFWLGTMVLLATLAFGALMTALNNALFFDGYAEDGAFQLLNPVRRIVEGEVIGRDFNFFHGIGTPLLHVPAYLLFGQGIFGEEMARWLVSPFLFVGSAFCFFYVVKRSVLFALGMAATVTAVSMVIIPFLVLPITSILGVRSVIPVFLLAAVLGQRRLQGRVWRRNHRVARDWTWYEVITAGLLVLGLICGTEFGVAAVLAFGIAHLAYRTRDNQPFRERVWSGLRILIGFGVVLTVLLTAITQGRPFIPLSYAFVDIPTDQLWYFGVPPNSFLHTGNIVRTFLADQSLHVMLVLAVIALGLTVKLHRLRTYRVEVQAFLFGWLAGLFAMVSMLGYYSSTQVGALARMAILVSAAALFMLAARRRWPVHVGLELGRFKQRLRVGRAGALRVIAGLYVVAALVYAGVLFGWVKSSFDIFKTARKAYEYAAGLDTDALSTRWQNISEMIVPIIQADNYVPIVDYNDHGFVHGVNAETREVVVWPADKVTFLRAGQVVYLQKAGRQTIARTRKIDEARIVVSLQDKTATLDPVADGDSGKLIVAEDFAHDDTKVWSFYTGVLNQEMGLVNPSRDGYDYIIHALGKQRRQEYVDDFARIQPTYVTTFTYPYFGWEGWMENEHWDLYSLLDKNYEVVQETSVYALWKRKDQAWQKDGYAGAAWKPLPASDGNGKIPLPKLSFDNLPDVESYGQRIMQLQRERLEMMGRPFDKHPQLEQDEYDKHVIQRIRDGRQWELYRKDNNGDRTEEQLHAEDIKKRTAVSDTSPVLHLPRPKRQVVLVKVTYETSYSPEWMVALGRPVRYMIEMEGVYSKTAKSLRPYAREAVFPVVLSEFNEDPYLQLKTYSLLPGSGSIKILDAQWAPLETSVANLKFFTD